MELSEYINLTLTEIAKGVQKANAPYEDAGRCFVLSETALKINGIPTAYWDDSDGSTYKPIINVGFRVGIEIEETNEKGGRLGGSLKVVVLDADMTKKDGSKSIHEITFQLPLILPE